MVRPSPPAITWRLADRTYTVDEYLDRQPVMALLIAKDGQLVYERYQFGRSAQHLYLSNSIAKSFTGLATILAQHEGRLPDLDVPARQHVAALAGSAYGETTLRNLLRMGSGVRFDETNDPGDDLSRFRQDWSVRGVVAAPRRPAVPAAQRHRLGLRALLLAAGQRHASLRDAGPARPGGLRRPHEPADDGALRGQRQPAHGGHDDGPRARRAVARRGAGLRALVARGRGRAVSAEGQVNRATTHGCLAPRGAGCAPGPSRAKRPAVGAAVERPAGRHVLVNSYLLR